MSTVSLAMKLENYLPPLVEPPPVAVVAVQKQYSTRQSYETLVVVLAVITILAVIAGMIARLCGGRHGGDRDIEGWVELNCRSCIDAGVSTSTNDNAGVSVAATLPEESKPDTEEIKKA